jgi:molybdopterin-guanine dinucleotide biosynthesis protein
MEINRRIKPRQSGKTTDIIELVVVLLSIGRKVALIMPSDRETAWLRQTHKDLVLNKDYQGCLFIGSASNLLFMRGIRVDCVVVDEFKESKFQQEIILLTDVNSAVLYTTET